MNELMEKLERYKKPVVGVAVSAWTRTGPAFLLPNYHIICLLETAELDAIRKKCKVRSFTKNLSIDPESLAKKNTASILKNKKVQSFLRSLGPHISLLLYKSSKSVEKICRKLDIKILAPGSEIRDPFEDKKEFRILGKKAGLRLIPGETLMINDFNQLKYAEMRQKYGSRLVFQLPDYKVGGGIGTFFIEDDEDYQQAMGFIKRRRRAGKKLIWINVSKRIEGTAGSICACVTRHGVLCSLVQTQLVDVPQARAFAGRSGVWLGHDWAWKTFSLRIQKRAEAVARTLGAYMHQLGYRGMFGVDLVIDEKKEEVWPVECNARFTGGFPAYSMMQVVHGEVPFDAFYLLEFLNLDYDLDLDAMQKQYRKPKIGSHIILHNQERKWVRAGGRVQGGVYRMVDKELVWQRPGFCMQDIENEEEFVICDRCPNKGMVLKPGERLARLLFRTKICQSDDRLLAWAAKLCRRVYRKYELREISSRKEDVGYG